MSMQNEQTRIVPGKPIREPHNFPVTWENGEDQRLFWELDGYHYPNPMAPLEFELTVAIYEEGGNRVTAEFGIPLNMAARRINTYFYRAAVPEGVPPNGVIRLLNQIRRFAPGVVQAIEDRAVAGITAKYMGPLNPILDDLEGYWRDTLLPEVKGYLGRWDAYDMESASLQELLNHLNRVLSEAERLGVIHFLIHGPNVFAMSQFEELFNDLFQEGGDDSADALGAYRLLQGFDNLILRGDRMLWGLGRKAQTMPAVQKILEEQAADRVVSALKKSAVGQVFLDELDDLLREHGQRGAMYSAIGEVSWLEDPTPVIKILKEYVSQPDRDMEAELAAEAAERERLVNQTRQLLQRYPQAVKDEFERLLKAAQVATVLHSDHGYWIDYRAMYGVRRVLLALGNRLVDGGVIDAPEDVLFLWLDELRAAAAEANGPIKKDVIAARKEEMARFGAIEPPPMLGTAPLMPPLAGEPLFRAISKTTGAQSMASDNGQPGCLQGNAGSPGTVRGTARIIRSLSEASRLRPGEILVAETTAPPWTPLFASAAAVVTDTGGILSHCAVVAREYHIPAVVGTGQATKAIMDGQMIEVNGDKGTVRILA